MVPVGRISGTRHPAMGVSCGTDGRVPFTMRWGVSFTSYAVNGIREAAALPLSIPAAPRGNRCCALRSPPACLTAAGSTRHPVSVRLCPPSGNRCRGDNAGWRWRLSGLRFVSQQLRLGGGMLPPHFVQVVILIARFGVFVPRLVDDVMDILHP